jgi:hypothetical protein
VLPAVEHAIAHRRSRDEGHRSNNRDFACYFTNWLISTRPDVVYWDQVDHAVLDAYIEYLKAKGSVAPKAAKNYVGPLVMASRHWAARQPNLHRVLIADNAYLFIRKKPAKNILRAREAYLLLKFAMMSNSRPARLGIALGAFAGLDIRDIARLRVQDVIPDEQAIDIW